MRYDYAAAEHYFERAIRAEGWKSESFLKAGRYALSFSGHEMAARFFERALKRDENAIEILVELARIEMRHNRPGQAAGLADRALRLNPDFTPALLVRSRLRRQAGELEEAEKMLRSFVSKPEPNGWVQAEGWYELGALLDRQGRFDEAVKAFLEAKSVKLSVATQPEAEWRTAEAAFRQWAESLSSGVFQRWRDSVAAFPPQRLALLCGHPRSGTTLLEQVLDAHPKIVSAEETSIFSTRHSLPLRMACRRRPLHFCRIWTPPRPASCGNRGKLISVAPKLLSAKRSRGAC